MSIKIYFKEYNKFEEYRDLLKKLKNVDFISNNKDITIYDANKININCGKYYVNSERKDYTLVLEFDDVLKVDIKGGV